jgi:phosphoribosylaminoimidazole (AIR) synthetase
MFEYFNCGIDYLIIIDHTKSSVENILQQLTQTQTICFLLGTFTSTSKDFAKINFIEYNFAFLFFRF